MAEGKLPGSAPDGEPRSSWADDPGKVRLLKRAVIIMGILLVAGMVVVVMTIIYRASTLGAGKPGQPSAGFDDVNLALPADEAIERLALDGDRLVLQTGEHIIIIDIRRGRVVGRLNLRAGQ